MKWILGALAALFLCPAFADMLDDLDDKQLCQQWVEFVELAQQQKFRGAEFKFVYLTEEQVRHMMEHRHQFDDALYFYAHEGLTEREKKFWEDAATLGWNSPTLHGRQLWLTCPVRM